MPGFANFYRAINGRDPFPWQDRLAIEVARTDEWPREIGVPTGLGKTACLDVAIWWLASQAHLAPAERIAPTRIWWVVNRRLLVDSTFEHAERMSGRLKEAVSGGGLDGIVAAVGTRLRAISARGMDPLEVVRLRGGVASGRPTDPSQPAVILSTVPMYGSRLLFRGYGSTTSMRPIDAALAGTDGLVLLDEAHLARHLPRLLDSLADCAPARVGLPAARRASPRLVSLTATGEAAEEDRFDLDENDWEHDVVRRRVEAAKPMELRRTAGNAGVALAKATLDLMRKAPKSATFIVFANHPKTARDVFGRLQANVQDVLLLTGRTREFEAAPIRERVLDGASGMAASRDPAVEREQPLVVVATQTLEVGADVDAEYLVTEGCGVRALTQRLGRLNRLGRFPHARAVYVHTAPTTKAKGREPAGWPVYGTEPAAVLEQLEQASVRGAEQVDMSPRNVAKVLGAPCENAGRAPEILYGLLWEWMKTTQPPLGEAPVEPYFSGISDRDYTVSIIWRAHVPEQDERLWPRPREDEAVDVPVGEVRDALKAEEDVRRVSSDGFTIENCAVKELRPGDRIVLPSTRGLLDRFGWNPDSASPVFDMSLAKRGLPLNAEALKRLCGVAVGGWIKVALGESDGAEEVDELEQARAIQAILDALQAAGAPALWGPDEWDAFLSSLDSEVEHGATNEVSRLVVAQRKSERERPADEAMYLDLHCKAVGDEAGRIALRYGLPSRLVETLRIAGQLHDCGKAELRFQKWLNPTGDGSGRLVAKSRYPRDLWQRYRRASGWPRGGRHEALSARLAEAWLDAEGDPDGCLLRDLLLHLVISHHGMGRPLVMPSPDETAAAVDVEIEGRRFSVPAALSEVDWNQPSRFRRLNKEYGPWGLALLEAILRQADHAVSAATQVQRAKEDR